MIVGDLVRPKESHADMFSSHDDIGVVLEVHHPRTAQPDYRTPTSLLVFFPHAGLKKKWFHKYELEMVNVRG